MAKFSKIAKIKSHKSPGKIGTCACFWEFERGGRGEYVISYRVSKRERIYVKKKSRRKKERRTHTFTKAFF